MVLSELVEICDSTTVLSVWQQNDAGKIENLFNLSPNALRSLSRVAGFGDALFIGAEIDFIRVGHHGDIIVNLKDGSNKNEG